MNKVTYERRTSSSVKTVNPLITILGDTLDFEEFCAELACEPHLSPDFVSAGSIGRKRLLEKKLYLPNTQAFAVYKKVHELIQLGYENRNPVDADYDKYLHQVPINTIRLDELSAPDILLNSGTSLFITGRSGLGKSETFLRTLPLLPSVALQTIKTDNRERVLTQVVWIKTDVHPKGNRRSLLMSIVQQIDKKLGTHFAAQLNPRQSVAMHLSTVTKICRMVNLGLIVFDESQWVLKANASNSVSAVTTQFFELLFNCLGVPLIFVGTEEAVDVLQMGSPQTVRRLTNAGHMKLLEISREEPEWENLINIVFTHYIGINSTKITPGFLKEMHYYTEGNISRLKRMALFIIERQEVKREALDSNFLYDVYKTVFQYESDLKSSYQKPDTALGGKSTKAKNVNRNNTKPQNAKDVSNSRAAAMKAMQELSKLQNNGYF